MVDGPDRINGITAAGGAYGQDIEAVAQKVADYLERRFFLPVYPVSDLEQNLILFTNPDGDLVTTLAPDSESICVCVDGEWVEIPLSEILEEEQPEPKPQQPPIAHDDPWQNNDYCPPQQPAPYSNPSNDSNQYKQSLQPFAELPLQELHVEPPQDPRDDLDLDPDLDEKVAGSRALASGGSADLPEGPAVAAGTMSDVDGVILPVQMPAGDETLLIATPTGTAPAVADPAPKPADTAPDAQVAASGVAVVAPGAARGDAVPRAIVNGAFVAVRSDAHDRDAEAAFMTLPIPHASASTLGLLELGATSIRAANVAGFALPFAAPFYMAAMAAMPRKEHCHDPFVARDQGPARNGFAMPALFTAGPAEIEHDPMAIAYAAAQSGLGTLLFPSVAVPSSALASDDRLTLRVGKSQDPQDTHRERDNDGNGRDGRNRDDEGEDQQDA